MYTDHSELDFDTLKVVKKALESDSTVTDIEMFRNLEGNDVITYHQYGIKKLITIIHLD